MPKGSYNRKSTSRSKRVAPAKPATQRRRKSPVKTVGVCQPMDVEPPARVPVNVEEERSKWEGMDVEEAANIAEGMNIEAPTTIVPKNYVRPATALPEGYRAPDFYSALVIHGASLNTYFVLPPHIEVVIFSRRGQVIIDYIIGKLLKWINKDYYTISKSSLQEYHLKRLVEKKCSGESILAKEFSYKLLQQSHSQYTKSRRFKPYKSYFTATLQTFRGGHECPDINLQNDKIGKRGIGDMNGFWDFKPLSRDEGRSDVLIDKLLPYPSTMKLSELLKYIVPDTTKPTRLYLFCCRVEPVGKEASRNSNASQASSVNLDELAKSQSSQSQ